MRFHPAQIILLFTLSFTACTGLKNVTSDDPLFTGNRYKIEDATKEVKSVVDQANSGMLPRPNNRFLWMRPALARYNMLSDSGRAKKFWRKKIDEQVTISQVNPYRTAEIIQNRLWHNGYFNNSITFDTITRGDKKAAIEFSIVLNTPQRFGNISYPEPADTLTRLINNAASESLIQEGDIYSLEALKNERTRLDRMLKDNGYIYFNPDFIGFRADSVTEDYTIDIDVRVKGSTPPESRTQFRVRNVYIVDEQPGQEGMLDTIIAHPFYLLTVDSAVSMNALKRGVFIEPGQLYSRTTRTRTTRYMNSLPIIRTATTRFLRKDSTDMLDAMLFLNKQKRYATTAELNAIFRSTNYFGPGVQFSIIDRNRRRSAERLRLNLRGRFEIQIQDGAINPAYELGIELNYLFPKLVPRFLDNLGRSKLPQTRISTGYNLFNRLDLYLLNSVFFNFGYKWFRNERVSHILNPIEIIFTAIPEDSKSDEFREYLKENPGVARSFEEQFVVGSGYEYIFDPVSIGTGNLFFRGGIDFAGNLLSLGYSAFNAPKDSLGRYTLFGVPFSQFGRVRTDLRYGIDLNRNSAVVARFSTGLGIPYGNSDILPYIKQFYVGGTNSLRSFLARSIGPGGEIPPEGFNDLTGDIRLEFNFEYRFTISGKLKGALFTDTGNIWLWNFDETRPAGNFKWDTWVDQLAISSGWGLRWDFDFVIARLDFAYTVRLPYEIEGSNWNKDIRFWNPTINIAVGYPF